MKVEELLKMVDDAIGKVSLKIVDSTNRIFETPYTSWEFSKKSLKLQDELDRLKKMKEFLEGRDPEEDAEMLFSKEELEEILRYLTYMRNLDTYEP